MLHLAGLVMQPLAADALSYMAPILWLYLPSRGVAFIAASTARAPFLSTVPRAPSPGLPPRLAPTSLPASATLLPLLPPPLFDASAD